MNRRVGVVVMAKAPVPGRTKTRLVPALTPPQAAELYSAMLADRCAQVASLSGVTPAIALVGCDGATVGADVVPEGFRRVPQPDGDLGACLAAAAACFLTDGTPVVLVDSDSPSLPIAYVEEAVERLRGAEADLVVGPAEDGGYYLIGLMRPQPELFRDVPWSTSEVVPMTLERAKALGLSVHVLPTWWDVDTPEDLERLRKALLHTWWPTRTAAWLRAHEPPPPRQAGGVVVPVADRWHTPWRKLSSRSVYATPWLSVREDVARTPDGGLTTYSIIETGECVGLLPFLDEETVLLVRQYRYVSGRVTWEMPTGGVHRGETIEAAARRELAEEAHVRAGRLESLGRYHTSKSVMDETAHLFVARDLERTSGEGDETEFIGVERVPFRQVLAMVRSGEIVDGMTIIAVLRVALARGSAAP